MGEEKETVKSKFERQYDRSRALVDKIAQFGVKPVLNTLYQVYPVEFDKPEVRRRMREAVQPHARPLSQFDLNATRMLARNRGIKIAICCMPKSGSTFLMSSLSRALDLPIRYIHTPYMNADFVGGHSREHELDELAVLLGEMARTGWVAQMHAKRTVYTERVFAARNIRAIVTFRNVFDCIVSMDDMLTAGQVEGFSMLRPPRDYRSMAPEDRLSFLTGYVGPWYIDYIVSWSRAKGRVLRLRYEEDILGFDRAVADKLRAYVGAEDVDPDAFMAAFALDGDDNRQKKARLNKGVAGRGESIPQAARDQLRRLADVYGREVDFTGLL